VSGLKTVTWNFATAVIVVGTGAGLIGMIRGNPPQSSDGFANVVLLGVLWLALLAIVLFMQLRS